MGWVKQVLKALRAGRPVQVRPGFRYLSNALLTIAPTDPDDVAVPDVVFVQWKTGSLILTVAEVQPEELVLTGDLGFERRVLRSAVLGKVTSVEKDYQLLDPIRPEIKYEILISDGPPSEAHGDYEGNTFHFYAKYDFWEFILSPLPQHPAFLLATLVGRDLEAGGLPFAEEEIAAFRQCFVREGTYGKKGTSAASYMPEAEVLRIIRECITEYDALVQRKERLPLGPSPDEAE